MPRADRVPFLPGRRLITIPAILNERFDAFLIADSGAQRSVLSQRVAQRLNLGPPLRAQALVGIGRSPPVPVVRLDRLRVGASTVRSLEVFVYDLPLLLATDGLLGLDFLRRFRVTFDFDSGVLILREPRRP
jgi:predicted aspartyl protease